MARIERIARLLVPGASISAGCDIRAQDASKVIKAGRGVFPTSVRSFGNPPRQRH